MPDMEQSAAYCLGRTEAELEYALTQAMVDALQASEGSHDYSASTAYRDGLAAAVEILHDNLKKIGWRSDV